MPVPPTGGLAETIDHEMQASNTLPCRLCGADAEPTFRLNLLGRHDVQLWCCSQCASLETDPPTWLDEAYESAIAGNDTGAVNRNLVTHAAISAVARILGLKGPFLDFGGGAGMLCRLLRDNGFDAWLYDRYAEPVYARAHALGAQAIRSRSWELVSAVEVFEHCPAPTTDLDEMFGLGPQVLFATTILYEGQGPDWWYLTPSTGQHVFLYSRHGMELLAAQKGYHYADFGMFHIFSRQALSTVRKVMLRLALSRLGLRAGRICLAASQTGRYADADNRALSSPR